jgi:cation diffusion facilitator family transporter
MISDSTPNDSRHAQREKCTVAIASLLAAGLLTAAKLAVGIWTNSLGVLSEAAHSGLDLVAAAVTLWAVQIAARPADPDHTYGHGKFENLSALFETLLLLATCVWVVYEASQRLFLGRQAEVEANIWAFLVVIGSIAVDFSRSRALQRVALKYSSQALEADALHFSTDIWSSAVVLLGLAAVWAAKQFNLPALALADSLAALGVAMIVVWVSVQLGRKSLDDLLDRIPTELRQQVMAAVSAVLGVLEVTQLRVRRSGPETFADLTIRVRRSAAFEKVHEITEQVEAAVRSVFPTADVVVHVEPVAGQEEDITTTVRVLAARHGLGAHAIRIYEDAGERALELHVEVNDSLSLEEAHRQASEFEADLRGTVGGLGRIVTHIEPAGDAAATLQAEPAGRLLLNRALAEFLKTSTLHVQPHNVHVQMVGGELAISLHCRLDPATSITDAHEFTVRLEEYLRARVPKVGRVVIHVEPAKKKG